MKKDMNILFEVKHPETGEKFDAVVQFDEQQMEEQYGEREDLQDLMDGELGSLMPEDG